MLVKTRELAHFLLGKKRKIDFIAPNFELDRHDTEEMRQKILNLSYAEWQNMGFSKGTLHNLKKNATAKKPFYMQKQVYERMIEI